MPPVAEPPRRRRPSPETAGVPSSPTAAPRREGRVVPNLFIVGAPRCGTSSLYFYLKSHPRVFMSEPKEPHYFGSDLKIRLRPWATEDAYLALFDGAGDVQHAGEASVLYLYSRTAPEEILRLSPEARIIIMLRDPVEFIESLHAHNLLQGYEDIQDLEAALDAQSDRRKGNRIPPGCIPPISLQYESLARYAEHVVRYREAFGPDRVLCVLLQDLQTQRDSACERILGFLGLDGTGLPPFGTVNERQHWRFRRLGQAALSAYRRAGALGLRIPWKPIRLPLLLMNWATFRLPMKLNLAAGRRASMAPELRKAVRERLRDDVGWLGEVLRRDLSTWCDPRTDANNRKVTRGY